MHNDEHDRPAPEVGYRKPPENTRFKKGQSGNPKGRPRRKHGPAETLNRALQEQVIVNEAGRRKKITKLEAAFKQIANKAATGDQGALRLLLPFLQLLQSRLDNQIQETNVLDETDEQFVKSLLERLNLHSSGGPDQ